MYDTSMVRDATPTVNQNVDLLIKKLNTAYISANTINNENNTRLASEIDDLTKEIYASPGSKVASLNDHYQHTMMTGVLVAAVGTVALFYVFSKL